MLFKALILEQPGSPVSSHATARCSSRNRDSGRRSDCFESRHRAVLFKVTASSVQQRVRFESRQRAMLFKVMWFGTTALQVSSHANARCSSRPRGHQDSEQPFRVTPTRDALQGLYGVSKRRHSFESRQRAMFFKVNVEAKACVSFESRQRAMLFKDAIWD